MKRIPKGLELGSVLFSIYVNNLILFLDFNNCNYANGTATQNVCRDQLEQHSSIALKLFLDHYMSINLLRAIFLVQLINVSMCGLKLETIQYKTEEQINYYEELLTMSLRDKTTFKTICFNFPQILTGIIEKQHVLTPFNFLF